MTSSLGEYAVHFDDAYYREIAPRLRPVRQKANWRAYTSLVLLAIVLALYTVRAIGAENWPSLLLPAVILFLAGFVLWKTTKLGLENFRRTPNYGAEVLVKLTTSGVETAGPLVSVQFDWRAFRKAVLSSDGIVLALTDGSGLWLPDVARVGGDRAAIEAVIAENLPEVERR